MIASLAMVARRPASVRSSSWRSGKVFGTMDGFTYKESATMSFGPHTFMVDECEHGRVCGS